MTLYGLLYIVIPLLAGLAVTMVSPWKALLGCVFLLPWAGLEADIGLRVTSFQLFYLPLFLHYLIKPGRWLKATARLNLLALLFVYGLIVTIIMLPFLPDALVSGGVLRSPRARSAIQILVFLYTLSPIAIAMHYCDDYERMRTALRVFVLSSLCLCGLGILQLVVWIVTGTDPLPLGIIQSFVNPDSITVRSGLFNFDGRIIYRMSSLGGEPKSLGQTLVISVFMLVWGYLNKVEIFRRHNLLIILVLLGSILLTQSTSAFLLLAAGMPVLLLLSASGETKKIFNVLWVSALITVIASLIFAIAYVVMDDSPITLIQARTTDRVNADVGYLEDFDAAIFVLLTHDPLVMIFGTGLGNAHLFADVYLTSEATVYAGGTTFVAKAGFLRVWSELGIIGLGIMMLFIGSLWVRMRNSRHSYMFHLVLMSFLAYMLVGQASVFFLIAGIALGLCCRDKGWKP